MFTRIKAALTYSNVMATVAVFLALGGSAYAAIKLPKNSVGSKQIKKNAVTSSKVKNGSLLAGDFKAGQLPAGAQGPKGDPGAKGDPGTPGGTGPAGPFPATLPSGKTLTGTYAAEDVNGTTNAHAYASISFQFPLTSAPDSHVVANGTTTPECQGTVTHPTALAGTLCIYRQTDSDVPTPFAPDINGGPTSPTGSVLSVIDAGGNAYLYGTWAVTAP